MSATAGTTTTATAWFVLILAGLFEVGWAVSLKYSKGFTRFWPSVSTIVLLAVSMVLLGIAQRTLPLGTAYAVWVGVGAFGAAILGMLLFDEPVTPMRVACLALLIASIVGLRLTSTPVPA
ncbi:MAG: multidrug efflux SMR transporter [Phycisphaerae bacterium]|nr:multidrug efflux SMR transporter [Phycisphaerae bacterium]